MSTVVIAETYEGASKLFAALSSPVRIAIVALLSAEERCVHELVDALDLPQPLVSQHLRVLRGAQLVTGRRRGREVAYALSDDHVGHIVRDALQHSTEPHAKPGRTPSGAKQ
jgi:ArsR family transcriptional regulator, zinc-responsive transcriptional repressor